MDEKTILDICAQDAEKANQLCEQYRKNFRERDYKDVEEFVYVEELVVDDSSAGVIWSFDTDD